MTPLADLLSTVFERGYRFRASAPQDDRPIEALTAELVGAAGEIHGLKVAKTILDRYAAFDDEEKLSFFNFLAEDMAISPSSVRAALDGYEAGQTKASYRTLLAACDPPRQELIRRLNQVPAATQALVKMRADLLRLGRDNDALSALDLDFRHLFASWFNRGFLVLRPINWQSPADILDKIIDYEAVHAIDGWDDLRQRLKPSDRRCFAFFHPAMPDEPLIFVEVALTKGIPGSIQGLLSAERDKIEAENADTAVFYSISNCQAGLASISFGNSLIKQVVSDLSSELPGLSTFITLSPIPGLSLWADQAGHKQDIGDPDHMKGLAAHYLLTAKRPDGRPLDRVARFHLSNGATVHRVHPGADVSDKGLKQSGGVMVNYLYDTDTVIPNHERFASSHTVAASSEIKSLSASFATSAAKEQSHGKSSLRQAVWDTRW